MPSTLILVHSGTGNSVRVAMWLAECLRSDGHTVEVAQVVSGPPPPVTPINDPGLLALAFPTHGFTAPWSVLRHALSLPRGQGRPVLVLATRGGTRWGSWCAPGVEGSAAVLVAAILALKGWRVLGWRGVDMPSNWTALHSALGPRSVEAIRTRAHRQVATVAQRLAAGKPVMDFGTMVQTLLGIVLAPISLGYLLIGRQLLAKLFMASEACDGCGTCRDRCPHGAIRWFRNRPYWTLSCESCIRCMSVCPRQAVQATQAMAVAYMLVGITAAGALSAGIIHLWPSLEPWLGRDLPAMVLHAMVFTVVFAVTYAVAWLVGRTPILGLLTHGLTLTRGYRRHRDPEVTVGQLLPAHHPRQTIPKT